MSSETSLPSKQEKESYLNIQIDSLTKAILPMTQIQEVIVTEIEAITPIPNMEPYVLGLLNQRNKAVWLIDLAAKFNLTQLNLEKQTCNVIIINLGKKSLGLAVEKVNGMIKVLPELIISPVETVSLEILPYLRGCFFEPSNSMFLVLEGEAFLSDGVT